MERRDVSLSKITAIGLLGLCLTTHSVAKDAAQASPPVSSNEAAAQAEQDDLQPKIAPLLAFILQRIIVAGLDADMAKPNGLFNRLKTSLGFGSAPELVNKDDSLAPAVGYALQHLDSGSFEVKTALNVGEVPTVLKTGDVFAIQYSTNLPGQIRLENINPMGQVSDLGTYTVLVDQLNRLPLERGIQLQGEPGMELLKIYFYPCLPPEAAGQPWANRFAPQLPLCAGTQNNQLEAAVRGTTKTRSLVNLAQPNSAMAFSGLADYRKNEVTMTVIRIQHERPGNGQ